MYNVEIQRVFITTFTPNTGIPIQSSYSCCCLSEPLKYRTDFPVPFLISTGKTPYSTPKENDLPSAYLDTLATPTAFVTHLVDPKPFPGSNKAGSLQLDRGGYSQEEFYAGTKFSSASILLQSLHP